MPVFAAETGILFSIKNNLKKTIKKVCKRKQNALIFASSNVHKKNLSKMANFEITLPDGEKRHLGECIALNGVIVKPTKMGVGKSRTEVFATGGGDYDEAEVYDRYETAYICFFSKVKCARHGLSEPPKPENGKHFTATEIVKYSNLMFFVGDNGDGYIMRNLDHEKEKAATVKQQQIADKKEPIEIGKGYGYWEIHTRLPKEVWGLVKPYAEYCNGDESWMEWFDDQYPGISRSDIIGWHYKFEAIEALLSAGFPIEYCGKIITEPGDIANVQEALAEAEKIVKQKAREEKERKSATLAEWRSLDWKYATEDQCRIAESLPALTSETLGFKGQDIYGGGQWYHVSDTHLFTVSNNGMDGDDWSRNNYRTGGAGAICLMVERSETVNQLLTKI